MNPLVTTGQDRRRDVTALSVNVNKIALLRNQRPLAIPSVVGLARIALEAGAHGITVHPRPDERHIRAGDVRELAALLKDWPDAELNIEGNPHQNLMPLVRELRPHQCTFVPDDAAQATSDHCWDLAGDDGRLAPLVAEARSLGIRVSQGVTMHGFALNCDVDLSWYDRFVPCGIDDAGITSLSDELGRDVTVHEVLPSVRRNLTDLLAWAPYVATPDYEPRPEPGRVARVPVLGLPG